MKKYHPFHIVSESPWPIMASITFLGMTTATALWAHFHKSILMSTVIPLALMVAFQWWRDVTRETGDEGLHSKKVMTGLKMGMILFILSEVMFFVSFFWAYFQSSISPSPEIGIFWPPIGVNMFDPLNIPLLNTILLVSSGISITWSHHSIMENKMSESSKALIITIILGAYFTMLQGAEYWQAEFTISDSVSGSTFFVATGFHGLHVLIGSTFLIITLNLMSKMTMESNHVISFETAAWYWHFVDIVWLFLYTCIYWWGT